MFFFFFFSDVPPAERGFELNFFVDGLPLFKSSRSQFWPILSRAHNVPRLPVKTVAIFCGESKPLSLDEYFEKFVKEMNRLQANGLKIGSRVYWVKLRAIIADALARAYIKGKAKQAINLNMICNCTMANFFLQVLRR